MSELSKAQGTDQADHKKFESAAISSANQMQQQLFLLEDTVMTMTTAVTTISKVMQRWGKVIVPMMFGFILLAAYGFYLIYRLTTDIGMMSQNMALMTQTVDRNMTVMAAELTSIQQEVKTMSSGVVSMNDHLKNMNDSMLNMTYGVRQIAMTTNQMGSDFQSISAPVNSMSQWVPWSMMGGRNYEPAPQMMPPVSQPYYYTPAPEYIPAPAAAENP